MRSLASHRVARALGALALGLSVASASPAAADAETPQPEDPRLAHEEAEELFNQGEFRRAADLWESVLARVGPDKAWRANYNLGLCYQKLGEATLAVERFDAFITRVKAMAEVPEALAVLAEDAETRSAAIRASHGGVALAASPGVKVRIDGGEARDVGFTAYLAPGVHTVEIVYPVGARRVELDLHAGRVIAVDTTPPAPERPTPLPPPSRPEEAPSFPTVLFVVGLSVTAVSFVLPGVLFAVADESRSEAEALGAGHSGYAAARDEFEGDRAAYQLSYILPGALGAITAAIAVVGAVRVATGSPSPAKDAARAAAGVSLSPGGGVVWLSGGF
jgi:tetratricopeptide (TPR) repeat protein